MLEYIELGFEARLHCPDAGLPDFLGVTLRGALGHVLRQTVCQMRCGECARCFLRAVCPYPSVFEGLAPEGRQILRKYPKIPQPFVLVVPPPGGRDRDGKLRFGLRLFGGACSFWPYVVHAFTVAGQRGIGTGRWRYDLVCVTDGLQGMPIWTGAGSPQAEPQRRVLAPPASALPEHCAIRWRFVTPVRIHSEGRSYTASVSPLDIILAGRRRYSVMMHFYGDIKENIIGSDRHVRHDEFAVRESRWQQWCISRFSGRQQRRITLDGVLGESIIQGPWGSTGPWLYGITTLHIGKAISFGLGRVTWEQV